MKTIKLFLAIMLLTIMSYSYGQLKNEVPKDSLIAFWNFKNSLFGISSNNDSTEFWDYSIFDLDRFGDSSAIYEPDGFVITEQISGLYNIITINMWFKAPDYQDTFCRLPIFSNMHNDNSGRYSLSINAGGNGQLISQKWNNQASICIERSGFIIDSNKVAISNILTNDNNWHMVTAIKNEYLYSIYIDGIFQDSFYDNDSIKLNDTTRLYFGENKNSKYETTGKNFNYGYLDDVGIWNRVLNVDEIKLLYNGCSLISKQPENQFVIEGSNAIFSINTKYNFTTIDWEMNIGYGFASTNWTSDTISFAALNSLDLAEFRGIVNTPYSNNCIDTSDIAILDVTHVGLEDISVNNEIDIYPNPTDGRIQLIFDNSYGDFKKIRLVSSFGTNILHYETIENKIDIDISQFPSGVYLISIETDGGTYYRKIIIQR